MPGGGLVDGPHAPSSGEELSAVDAASADDVWAVGARLEELDSYIQFSLILHWDGTSWSRTESPNVGPLTDVATAAADDAWAIGGDDILHWDGAAWSRSPHPAPEGANFSAIDAAAPDDAWVVGIRHGAEWVDEYGDRNVGYDTFTMHWDGSAWSVIPSPNGAPRHNSVQGVVAISETEAWVVGYSEQQEGPRTLILHWDGATWSVVASPNPGGDFNVLWGAGSDGDGPWAIGHYGDDDSRFMGMYLRWIQGGWELVPGPDGEAVHQTPTALSGVGEGGAWAVGSEPTSSFLIAHWDGEAWSAADATVPSSDPAASARLGDVVAISPTDAWAVGRLERPGDGDAYERHALVEHWDGTAWELVEVSSPN